MKFTGGEDEFLKKGIHRHGFGQWTAILRDPDPKFQTGRVADALKKRAELKFLSNKKAVCLFHENLYFQSVLRK